MSEWMERTICYAPGTGRRYFTAAKIWWNW
jgi:hypothetical protein